MNYTEDDLFDAVEEYPNPRLQDKYARLVGLDQEKDRISKEARILLRPKEIENWSQQYYGSVVPLARSFDERMPLLLFSGDVGTGKTSLAESFPDKVARDLKIATTLYRLSLGARGTGAVGQMTSLITTAFSRIEEAARKIAFDDSGPRGAIVLLIDEADALAQSRELSQMHHEDRAGVNALIRGIDRIGGGNHTAIVVLCTNRIEALDPAIVRRAADTFHFKRPNLEQRLTILGCSLSGLGFDNGQIQGLAQLLGDSNGLGYGCTYSDLTARFLPDVLLDAFPGSPVDFERVKAQAKEFTPTPPFRNGDDT